MIISCPNCSKKFQVPDNAIPKAGRTVQYKMVADFFLYRVVFKLHDNSYQLLAGVTGLEPAASCVTGRRSNQTELHPHHWWAVKASNL